MAAWRARVEALEGQLRAAGLEVEGEEGAGAEAMEVEAAA